MEFSPKELKEAARRNPAGLIRLGKFMGFRVDGMSAMQVARLIIWRMNVRRRYTRGLY